MNIPQKSLFSLLSCHLGAKKFYIRSKFGKVLTKNKFAQFFLDTVYTFFFCKSCTVSNCYNFDLHYSEIFILKIQPDSE